MREQRELIVRLLLFLAVVFSVNSLQAQDDSVASVTGQVASADTSSINTTRVVIIGGSVVGIMSAVHIYQSNGWWKYNRRSFHFREDLRYALHVDKIGHFFGASFETFVMSKAFRWANLSETSALCYGAGVSTLLQTYVEIEDGFSEWGFDRVDFAADVAGAWFPVVQHFVPPLQNFQLKVSYVPSQNVNAPGAFPGQKHLVMDDYEGQTFWFSLKINNILPKTLEPYWPDFLCLAMGYGARDILSTDPYRVYFISLDYDMTKIIPQDTGFLRVLSETLNFIHFPAPAVRISPSTIWYGLYF